MPGKPLVVAGRRRKINTGGPRTVRSMIREHLRYEKKLLADFAAMLGHNPATTRKLMSQTHRPFPPQYIDSFIEHMKLDEFDAYELRLQGAVEAGWQLNIGGKLE